MSVGIVGVDHIQLAIPPGEEALARLFYVNVLGLREIRRPKSIKVRGGLWLLGEGVTVHLATEEPFRPAERAHPAFIVGDLDLARRRLASARVEIVDDESVTGLRRCYLHDPFGNRIELIAASDAGFTGRRPAYPIWSKTARAGDR